MTIWLKKNNKLILNFISLGKTYSTLEYANAPLMKT